MKDFFAKLKYLFRWRDVLFAVFLIGIALLFAFCSAQNMIEVTFGDEAVDIVASKYSMNIPYEMIESVEIASISKNDEQINGRSDMALRTGIWKNETWGEYYGCMDLQTSNCVLIHLNDGRIFVFSQKSDEQVQADFETLQNYLNK